MDKRLFEEIRSKIIGEKFFLDNTSRKTLMNEFNIPANKFAVCSVSSRARHSANTSTI